MLETIDLRDLAQVQSHDLAVVSVYLAGPDGLGFLDRRERELAALLEGDDTAAEQFTETMRLIRQTLKENPVTNQGLALFACWALDFVRGYQLSVAPRRNMLRLGPTPYIRPLAELQEEHEPFLVVAADSQRARVIEVVSAEVAAEEGVRGNVKGRQKKGGWSQQRYARRRENQLAHYAGDVAETVERLVRDENFGRIVLLGTDETLREIEEHLPGHVADKVVGRRSIDLGAGEEAAMDQAWEVYFEAERASEQALWEQIREQHFAGGLAAAGPADVLAAAEAGRVETALLDRDLHLPAVQCRKCDHVTLTDAATAPPACPACGAEDNFPVSFVNALVARLERTSAQAEFTDSFTALSKLGGVAALLRY